MNKYAAYFAIESKIKGKGFDVHRSDLISEFTEGKERSLKALSDWDYQEFLRWLKPMLQNLENEKIKDWQNSPENRMRRKIIALFVHRMHYSMEGLDQWCIKSGLFHKPLNDHTKSELAKLVTQSEKVHVSFINSLNK